MINIFFINPLYFLKIREQETFCHCILNLAVQMQLISCVTSNIYIHHRKNKEHSYILDIYNNDEFKIASGQLQVIHFIVPMFYIGV